ncbi:MAG: hypothetical protein EU530_03035 [Promethearchaeota archaeon]|nr:MAG: hypothetical protein EU530_03035 [Candidatus Lokiarchaeota archaeon]
MLDLGVFPKIIFIMYSSSIKFEGYDLHNVPTSTGRADMLIRVIKNTLYLPDDYNFEIGFLLFPNPQFLLEVQQKLQVDSLNEKGFLISAKSNYFTKNPYTIVSEHELLQALYNSFEQLTNPSKESLFDKYIQLNFYECIFSFVEQGIPVYILSEEGTPLEYLNLFQNAQQDRVCFVVGDQIGFLNVDLEALPKSVFPISLGKTSFLGSTTITLIKWIIWHKQNSTHKL